MRYYRMSADQGNDYGQYGIGLLYASGLGVPKDVAQAREWMRKSVAGGNFYARAWLVTHGG